VVFIPLSKQPIELYDLRADAAEPRNLAASRPDLVAQAESLMKSARVEDSNWPLRVKPKPAPKAKARNAGKRKQAR
jgi:arylsulfatase A